MATREEIAALFPAMIERFVPEKAEGIDAVIQFDLSGDNGGMYWVKISGGEVSHGEGAADSPKMTLKAEADLWHDVANGKANVMQAFMTGKLKVQGDMNLGIKMQSIFQM